MDIDSAVLWQECCWAADAIVAQVAATIDVFSVLAIRHVASHVYCTYIHIYINIVFQTILFVRTKTLT